MIYSGVVGKIGETRTDNEFEIQTSLTDADLKSIFPDIVLNLNGKTLHVKVPLNITAEKFITELIQKGGTVHYFRDISSSTRRLFND
ncbi:MAG: hypothetical protein IPH24_06580 [Crocinitomicaceae bacterium]|nr:hypothetical protein [Crocinitomicaceae bacterium]